MRSKTKNRVIAMLAASSALCLGGALALFGSDNVRASAAEEYAAFVNVGATIKASDDDSALGLKTKSASVKVTGTVTEGDSLFSSYAEGATYELDLTAGSYNVAVAVIAEEGTSVTVGGENVEIPAGTTGKYVASKTVNATGKVEVSVNKKLCGVLVTEAGGDKMLMTADYDRGQVVSYSKLLAEELSDATGYYSDGSTEVMEIEYGNITAGGGVNVNFTTVEVGGKIKGTEMTVSCNVTTMPDNLVYFINSGSAPEDNPEQWAGTADEYYDHNKVILGYYGDTLLNDTHEQGPVQKGGNDWGYYNTDSAKKSTYTTTRVSFPYNTLRCFPENVGTSFGYMLTNLQAGAQYRIFVGTISAWHPRTVNIAFNGNVIGADTLRINSSKGFTVYENVSADGNGKIDICMTGASTNEPCISFVAAQPMETEYKAAGATPQSVSAIGVEETTIELVGITAGAKVQIYNAQKPNQIIYEEIAQEENFSGDVYMLDFKEKIAEGITQLNVVQITNGGASVPKLVYVTDIEDFEIVKTPEGYTTGSVTITVSAHADSGIANWSYRLGEYGAVNSFDLDRPYAIEKSFTVTENGDYIVVVTSGMGVTYSETVRIRNIDPDRPAIHVTPSAQGWQAGAYHVALRVESASPVTEYTLYKNGAQVATAATAPDAISLTEAGEYVIYVKTAAGRSSTGTVLVSEDPTTATVTKTYRNRTLKYTFTDNEHYEIAAVSAYQLTSTGATRMTIATGNVMDVYSAGQYVVTVTTKNGTVEMFSIDVAASDLKVTSANGGMSGGTALGIGLGVGIGGVVVGAAAVVLTIVLLKKKKN